MTEKEIIDYVKKTSLYGNPNASIGSDARSRFEAELRAFKAGYNMALESIKPILKIKSV